HPHIILYRLFMEDMIYTFHLYYARLIFGIDLGIAKSMRLGYFCNRQESIDLIKERNDLLDLWCQGITDHLVKILDVEDIDPQFIGIIFLLFENHGKAILD